MAPQRPLGRNEPDPFRAWQLLNLHRPALALRITEQLLALDPTSLSALLARVEALRQLQRLPEAAAAAHAAVAQSPQSAGAFYRLAQVLGQQGELWEAEVAIQNAIRLHSVNATYYGLLAQLRYLLRRADEAITSARDGLAINPQHPACLLWHALAQEKCGRPDKADTDFNVLLRTVPNCSLVHYRRGQLLLQRAEPQAAARHLAEALRLDPTDSALLIPLLRQALRRQHWPSWMARRHRRLQREWRQQHTLGWVTTGTALILPSFLLWSWWRNRQDPLFQLSPTQVWRRWLKVWLFSLLLLPVLIFSGSHFGIINGDKPLSMTQMIGLLIGGGTYQLIGYLIKRRIDSENLSELGAHPPT